MKKLILALDPGSRRTGYGIIEVDGDRLTHVHHGVIQLSEKWSFPERLRVLGHELRELYKKYPAPMTVVEKIFFGKNADSAFKLGHARGICLMCAAESGSQITEYAARYVKKIVTGNGGADKQQVQNLVFAYLRVRPEESGFDASDALSLAVCHARVYEGAERIQRMLEGAQ